MIKNTDLRIGNLVYHIDGRTVHQILFHDLGFEETPYEPIPLTETNIMQLRRVVSKLDYSPKEFSMREPGERQTDNNYYSSDINDFYKLHLSPSYKNQQDEKIVPEYWFVWFMTYGTGSGWFLPIQDLRQLKFVHQLQNLFYALTGTELTIKTEDNER